MECVCFKWCKPPAIQLSTGFCGWYPTWTDLWKARCFPRTLICTWWVVHIYKGQWWWGHSIVSWLHPTLLSHEDINYNWECEGNCFSHHKIPLSHHKTPLSHHNKTSFFSEFQNKLSFGTSPTGWQMEFYQESDNFFPKNQVKKIIGQDSPRCMPLAVAFWRS